MLHAGKGVSGVGTGGSNWSLSDFSKFVAQLQQEHIEVKNGVSCLSEENREFTGILERLKGDDGVVDRTGA